MSRTPAGQPPESDDTFDLLAQLLDEAGVAPSRADAITRRSDAAFAPMSFSQELLWLLDRATPGMTAYNMPIARRLRGALDLPALQQALDSVAARHEALRTRLTDASGEPRQVIDAPGPVAMLRINASGATPAEREAAATQIVRERARTPFDLAAEPCFRTTLVAIAPDDHVLVIETHHIAMDGWSKIPGFIVPTLRERLAQGASIASSAMLPALFFAVLSRWHRGELAYAYQDGVMDAVVAHALFADADPLAAYCRDPVLWGVLAGDPTLTAAIRAADGRVRDLFGS